MNKCFHFMFIKILREFYAPSSPQARWRDCTFLSGFMVSGVDKMQYKYMQLRRI